jgi:hypothetical protein
MKQIEENEKICESLKDFIINNLLRHCLQSVHDM